MGFFGKKSAPKAKRKPAKKKKSVHFPTTREAAIQRYKYDFDWEFERAYWYSRDELGGFKHERLVDAGALREARGIEIASRDDADALAEDTKELYIGDKITFALDDKDTGDVSIQGVEPFVYPVLQKEMVRRKKELKASVLARARDPQRKTKDPQGLRLAEESRGHSQWARDVASERGMKYTLMKRGSGGGGGLLQQTHTKKKRGDSGLRLSGTRKSSLGFVEN